MQKKIKDESRSFHSHLELACMCANIREIRIKSLMEMLPLGRKKCQDVKEVNHIIRRSCLKKYLVLDSPYLGL